MTVRRRSCRRAFTLVEMLVAMAVMGVVMSFAALEFRAVVFNYLGIDSHLSAEQQARVAIAKVDDISRQASVVDSVDPAALPSPAIVQPASTAGPTLQFTKTQCLDLSCIPTQNGVPKPCYDTVTIFVVPDSSVSNSDPIFQPHNLIEQTAPIDPTRSDCTGGDKAASRLIARNVENFTVQKAECGNGGGNCTYGQGYRIDISIFDYDDHSANSHEGTLYHLSSVITPLTFGESK